MTAWYNRTKCKSRLQGHLTQERLRTSKAWPKLKAKAAATRYIAQYVLCLWLEHGGSSVVDRTILGVIQLLVEFYKLLEEESMFLARAARTRIGEIGIELSTLYSSLASDSARLRRKYWKMSPKMHMFCHLCLHASSIYVGHLNPRYHWTYQDEDLVGLLVEVAQSCHTSTVAVSALFKWLHIAID